MSKPVSNVEIEDVLASIRRLVAEGDAPRADKAVVDLSAPDEFDAPMSQEPETDADAAPGKFVLTSAFRVDADASPPAEPDAAPLLLTTPAVEAAPVITVAPEVENKRSELESTIAELEAAISSGGQDFEPDGSEKEPIMDWQQATVSGAIFASPAMRGRMGEVVTPEGVFDSRRAAASGDKPVTLAERMTEKAANDRPDPVELFVHSQSDTPMPAASESAEAEPEFDEQLSSYLEKEQIIDEDKLRELVVEIVRDELQGALGERITRNVRKLVRREIYRILASEDFN